MYIYIHLYIPFLHSYKRWCGKQDLVDVAQRTTQRCVSLLRVCSHMNSFLLLLWYSKRKSEFTCEHSGLVHGHCPQQRVVAYSVCRFTYCSQWMVW